MRNAVKKLGLDCKLFYSGDKRGYNRVGMIMRGELRKMVIEVITVCDRLTV